MTRSQPYTPMVWVALAPDEPRKGQGGGVAVVAAAEAVIRRAHCSLGAVVGGRGGGSGVAWRGAGRGGAWERGAGGTGTAAPAPAPGTRRVSAARTVGQERQGRADFRRVTSS